MTEQELQLVQHKIELARRVGEARWEEEQRCIRVIEGEVWRAREDGNLEVALALLKAAERIIKEKLP